MNIDNLSKFAKISQENSDKNSVIKISFSESGLTEEMLVKDLDVIYKFENDNPEKEVQLSLKGLKLSLIEVAVKHSLVKPEIIDPWMIINILNLVKIYNNLDDSFFDNPVIYVSSIEELLDLKLSINTELKNFITTLSIYFLSLIKSYNKITYTPLDDHIELPNLYKIIFTSSDLLTISGIFSIADHFDTSKCMYIDNAGTYLSYFIFKQNLSNSLFERFLKIRK